MFSAPEEHVLLILSNEITKQVFLIDVETLPGGLPITYSVIFDRDLFIKINKPAGTHGIIVF